MVDSSTRTIALPSGERVEVSATPQDWWMSQNGYGFVSPNDIAPDPKNPRRRMSPGRQEELTESIKARGVRQSLVVTPRSLAPWARVAPEYEGCFFLAVSGHRRRNSALSVGLEAVPVKVAVYASEMEHRMDMSVLNKGQDELTPLDNGFEIVGLQEIGWKIEDLCASFGLQVPQLYNRMNLTKLHPDIQAMLDDDLPREKRVPLTVAGVLGGVKVPTPEELEGIFEELESVVPRDSITSEEDFEMLDGDDRRFTLQHLLLAAIKRRNLSSNRAIDFIRDRSMKLSSHKAAKHQKTERFQPRRRRLIIDTLINTIIGSDVVDWPTSELRRIFELAPREEVEDFIRRSREAEQLFCGLAGALERIRDAKKPTSPEVRGLMQREKTVA